MNENQTAEVLRLLTLSVSNTQELITTVARLETDVAELKTDVAELKTDVSDVKVRFSNLESEFQNHRAEFVSHRDETNKNFEKIHQTLARQDRRNNKVAGELMDMSLRLEKIEEEKEELV